MVKNLRNERSIELKIGFNNITDLNFSEVVGSLIVGRNSSSSSVVATT